MPVGDTLVPYILELRHRPHRAACARLGSYRRQRWSRGQVLDVALAVHDWLAAAGVAAGDRVLLHGASGPAWVASFFGGILRGAVLVPVDVRLGRGAVGEMAARAGCVAEIGDDLQPARAGCPRLCLDTLEPGTSTTAAGPSPARELARPSPDEHVEIVFTSGTTGRPQGVPITHRNLLASIHPIERGFRRREWIVAAVRPRLLCLVPGSHLFGQVVGMLLPVLMGLPVIFLDDLRPRAVRAAIRREKITVAIAVPRVLQLLRDDLIRDGMVPAPIAPSLAPWWRRAWIARRLRRQLGLRFAAWISGGARLDEEVEQFWDRLGYFVVQGYGMTETAPIISVSNPFARRRGNVGRPVAGQEIRIGPDGELWVRGENVASGYLDDPQATSRIFQDGWLRTGDRVERDAAGRLYLRGRIKDVIVAADGTNIDPGHVEEALESLSGVREAACVGTEGARGEEVHAVLILEEDTDPAAVVAAANRKLQPGERVQSFAVWHEPALPRTTTGKLRRAAVREVAGHLRRDGRHEKDGAAAPPAGNRSDPVRAALSELSGRVPGSLGQETDLERDLGLSSLDRLDLLVRLEELTGRTLDEESVAEATTLAALQNAVRQSPSPPLAMPRWAAGAAAGALRALGRGLLVRPLFRVLVRLRVEGRRHLDDLEPPFLIVANHESHLDTPAVLLGMPAGLRRRMAVAMSTEHFPALFQGGAGQAWAQRFGYWLAVLLFQAYPLPRGGGFSVTLAYTGELADRGQCPLIFPEGRMRHPGEPLPPFRHGPSVLARDLRLPVLPAGIQGSGACLPPGARRPRSGTIRVRFGAPLHLTRAERDGDIATFTRRLEDAVRALAAPPTGR